MKSRTFFRCLTLPVIAFLATPASGAVVAYWNFNSLSIATAGAPGTGSVPTSIAASSGTGTVGLSTWGGTVDDFAGSTINALNSDVSGASLSLISGGTASPFPGNDTFITVSFSLTDLQDLQLSFATRGTASGFNGGGWSWSTDGTNFTALANSTTATQSTTYATATVDFSAVTELDDADSVTLRYTLSGATSNSGNNRIENLQVTAVTLVPEPATTLLGALGFLGLLRRRR